MVHLSTEFFSSLRPSKHFPPKTANATGSNSMASLDFDSTGEFLVTASASTESIQLFSCETGESKKVIESKKYGAGQIKFAHKSSTVIYTTTNGEDNSIRYLSLHDEKYLRYFTGHKSRVSQIALSPLNDTFISIAPSESLCLWDLRTTHMQGRLDFTTPGSQNGLVAFDPQGLVFAVATGSKYIRLYDARNWERGAFSTFQLTNPESSTDNTGNWTNLQFSSDGKEILLGTSNITSTAAIVLDSFDGGVKGTFDAENVEGISYSGGIIYTPDSKFILGGRSDGQLDVWAADKFGKPVIDTIEGFSRESIKALAFNPKYALLSTVSNDGTVFYI